jgi:hypothetical protein
MNIKSNIYGLNNPLNKQTLQRFEKNQNYDVLIGE